MIKLVKGDIPAILHENAANWTEELLAEVDKGGDKVTYRKSKYNQPAIKDALVEETRGKCAYCESAPLHATYGDIEHIIPKASDLKVTFEWRNLTLACDICNTKKGDKEGLIDPYEDDPEENFEFAGPLIFHRAGKAKAEITRLELDLNRKNLLFKRAERIDALESRFRLINLHPDERERELILSATARFESDVGTEFSACAKSYLQATGRL